MRLVTFRRGRGEPKPGALWQEHVLDLGGLAKDLAVQRGTVRRGRGGFPRTILEIVQGSDAGCSVDIETYDVFFYSAEAVATGASPVTPEQA